MAGGAEQELACRELVEVVTDYLDGALPVPDRARFEAHLADCPYCVEYVAQMRRTIEAVGKLPAAPPDPARQKALLEAFRDWRRT